jgi:hypothetical protein
MAEVWVLVMLRRWSFGRFFEMPEHAAHPPGGIPQAPLRFLMVFKTPTLNFEIHHHDELITRPTTTTTTARKIDRGIFLELLILSRYSKYLRHGPKTQASRAEAPAQDRLYHIQVGQWPSRQGSHSTLHDPEA